MVNEYPLTDAMTTKELVVRGAELKMQIAAMDENLKAINLALSKVAEFKSGSKSAHILESGIKVTIQKKENVKWLQDRLMQVKDLLPGPFNDVFVYEYKPATAKALTFQMSENADFAAAVKWAQTVKPGAPSVSYERIEDEEVPNA